MSTIFGDDRSPSACLGASRVPILVWNLAPSSKAFVRFLGPWRGVWLHWSNCTVPCRGDGCRFCAAGKAQFWQGYAPALLWRERWLPIVCPITEALAGVLSGWELSGLIVELVREGRQRNSPVSCRVIEDAKAAKDPLPPAFDVEPILRRLWQLRRPADVPGPQAAGGEPAILLPFVRPDAAGDVPPAVEGSGT